MAPAAPDTRRRGTGSPRSPGSTASPSRSGVPRWTWYVVAGVLLLAAYLLWRRRGSSGALNTSGTPGPDLTGSAAQQPNGGASSVPGSLPPLLVDQPDPVTGQVQTADTTSSESPQTIAASADAPAYSGPSMPSPSTPGAPGTPLYLVATGQLAGASSGGTVLIGQDAKGSTQAQQQQAQVLATSAAENYAKNLTAAYQGYHTAGF